MIRSRCVCVYVYGCVFTQKQKIGRCAPHFMLTAMQPIRRIGNEMCIYLGLALMRNEGGRRRCWFRFLPPYPTWNELYVRAARVRWPPARAGNRGATLSHGHSRAPNVSALFGALSSSSSRSWSEGWAGLVRSFLGRFMCVRSWVGGTLLRWMRPAVRWCNIELERLKKRVIAVERERSNIPALVRYFGGNLRE